MKKFIITISIGMVIGGCTILGIIYFDKSEEATTQTDNTGEINGFYYENVWVENPTSGAKLLTTIQFPDTDEKAPLLLMIPGGLDSGERILEEEMTTTLLENGYIVAHFAADGRGESEGEEDYNGYTGQDGMHAVLTYLTSQDYVDNEKIGVISMSYGLVMASGMLARYDEPKVKFYIDWEGPPTKEYVGCDNKTNQSKLTWPTCDNTDFWSEREGYIFLEQIDIPYLRLQGIDDHAHGRDTYHATIAINAATNGNSPWTRVNGSENPENTTYTEENPPELIDRSSMNMIPVFVDELAEKFF